MFHSVRDTLGKGFSDKAQKKSRFSKPVGDDAVIGESIEAARRFLRREMGAEPPVDRNLGTLIRDFIYDRERRRRYTEAAWLHLSRPRKSTVDVYDIVLVGAGVHAAAFTYILSRARPDLRILVVEREQTVCAPFARLGDALVLNSPTFSKVGLNSNVVPEHFIQLTDLTNLWSVLFPLRNT